MVANIPRIWEIWGFHGVEDSSRFLQGEDGGSKVRRNVGFLPHHYTASRPI